MPPGVGNSEAFPRRSLSLLPPSAPCRCGPGFLVLGPETTGPHRTWSANLRRLWPATGSDIRPTSAQVGVEEGVTVSCACLACHSSSQLHDSPAHRRREQARAVLVCGDGARLLRAQLGWEPGSVGRFPPHAPTTQEAVPPAERDPETPSEFFGEDRRPPFDTLANPSFHWSPKALGFCSWPMMGMCPDL